MSTPTRLTLTDLNSDAVFTAQFNPNVLNKAIDVAYGRQEVLGLSHRPLQYLATENVTLSFALFNLVETVADLAYSNKFRAFLESLAYGPEAPSGIPSAAPAAVLVVWPNTISFVGRLMSLAIKYERWNQFGDVTQWSAAVTFEASQLSRITAKDIYDPNAPTIEARSDFIEPIDLL